eukprot:s27_g19.t1
MCSKSQPLTALLLPFVAWGDADFGGDCSAVRDQLKNVQQIQASGGGFAAVLADGNVVTWGHADPRAVLPAMPGEDKYWLKLKYISFSAGSLSPHFDPNRNDYELTIHNQDVESFTMTLSLELSKYDLLFLPRIEIDGNHTIYTPLNPLTHTLQLASHLALDPWLAATMLQHLVSGTVLNGTATLAKALQGPNDLENILADNSDPGFAPSQEAISFVGILRALIVLYAVFVIMALIDLQRPDVGDLVWGSVITQTS